MPFLYIPVLGWVREPLLLPRDGQAEAEEKQWQALEARGIDLDECRFRHPTYRPHPQSYRPDIPLRSPWRTALGPCVLRERKGLVTLTKEEKAAVGDREVIYR